MLGFGKKRFILTVGDDGAILTLADGTRMKQRIFAPSPTSEEAEKIKELMQRNRKIPVFVMVDILDQSYAQQTIPPVSMFTIKSIIRKKLRDLNPDDIKTAVLQSRSKTGRKDWNYMFVSIPNMPPLSEWIDLAIEMPNKFSGIFALPLEMESIVHDLSKEIKTEKKSTWKILVTHNKVGGVRQIVFRNDKFVLTRINQPVGVSEPEVIAGNIEQDLLNTVEFVRRIGYDEKEGLDVFVVASKEINSFLENNRINASHLALFTPFTMAEKLGMKNAASQDDKYCDVVLAVNFSVKNRLRNKLFSKTTDRLENVDAMDRLLIKAGTVISLFLMGFALYKTHAVYSLAKEYNLALQIKKTSEMKLEDVKKQAEQFPEDTNRVVTTLYYYNMLTNNNEMTFNFLKKFSELKGRLNLVKSIRMKIAEPDPNKIPPESGIEIGKTDMPKLKASFVIDLRLPKSNIEQILENANSFSSNIKNGFSEYDVVFRNMPNRDVVSTEIGRGPAVVDTSGIGVEFDGPKPPDPNKPADASKVAR